MTWKGPLRSSNFNPFAMGKDAFYYIMLRSTPTKGENRLIREYKQHNNRILAKVRGEMES